MVDFVAFAMVGALSVVGSPAVDSHTCPCLCFDLPPTSMTSLRSGGGNFSAACKSSSAGQSRVSRRPGSLELGSAFAGSRWQDWRLKTRAISGGAIRRPKRPSKGRRGLVVTSELGGQYEDGFEDVKTVSEANFCFWENLSTFCYLVL